MRHRASNSTGAYYVGLIALAALPLTEGWTAWLPILLGIQILGGLTVSVGYHRLFCHGAFKAHAAWHWAFALLGVFFMYGSPLQWVVTHAAHHRHSDTPLDPHPRGWRALLTKAYYDVPLPLWRARRLLRQQPALHRFVDRNYMGIWWLLVFAMLIASPEFFVRAYLPALGVAHLVGAVHNALSHRGGRPHDFWFMELLLPAGGEWLHGRHHERQGLASFRTRWYHLDPGAALIALIRSRGRAAVA